MDETPGLSMAKLELAYKASGTLDGAAVPGGEHNPTVTVVLTISMLGVVAIPHWIAASAHKSLTMATTIFENYDMFWTTTKNGYIDTPTMRSYGQRLRQQVGHDRPLLLLMDGQASHLVPEVVANLMGLKSGWW